MEPLLGCKLQPGYDPDVTPRPCMNPGVKTSRKRLLRSILAQATCEACRPSRPSSSTASSRRVREASCPRYTAVVVYFYRTYYNMHIRMYVWVYIYIYIYLFIYKHMYMHAYVHTDRPAYAQQFVSGCMSLSRSVRMYVSK